MTAPPPASRPDYYALLNVPRTATGDEIRASYRKLSRRYHPDQHAGAPPEVQQAATDRAAELNQAVEVLTDPFRRRLYDQMGDEGLKQVELASRFKTPEEAQRELRRVREEDEERSILSRANMQGVFIVGLAAAHTLRPYDRSLRGPPELANLAMQQSVQAPLTPSTIMTLGGTLAARNGMGGGSATASVKHTLASGMWIEGGATLGLGGSVMVRAQHRLDAITMGQVSYKYDEQGFSVGVLAQRQLGSAVQGTVAWSFGAEHGVAVGLARHTERWALDSELKVGVMGIGLTAAATRHLSSRSQLRAAAKIGTQGLELELGGGRRISTLSKLGLAVALGTEGVSLRVRFQRAGQTFMLPIQLAAGPDLPVAAAALAIPAAIYGVLKVVWLDPARKRRRREKLAARREQHRAFTMQERARAMADIALAEREYQRKVAAERSRGGLVIEDARYGNLRAPLEEQQDPEFPCVIDVTKPLQVLVDDGALVLHAGVKARLPGFYDPCFWVQDKQLFVRYSYRGRTYEVTVGDEDPLTLPHSEAAAAAAAASNS